MQNGDLSNEPQRKFVFVFEDLIAKPVTKRRRLKKITEFEVDPQVVAWLWDLTWRQNVAFDVATYDYTREQVTEVLNREGIPFGTVWTGPTPGALQRRLGYAPGVMAVYDANPSREFAYGGKGRIVRSGDRITL